MGSDTQPSVWRARASAGAQMEQQQQSIESPTKHDEFRLQQKQQPWYCRELLPALPRKGQRYKVREARQAPGTTARNT